MTSTGANLLNKALVLFLETWTLSPLIKDPHYSHEKFYSQGDSAQNFIQVPGWKYFLKIKD